MAGPGSRLVGCADGAGESLCLGVLAALRPPFLFPDLRWHSVLITDMKTGFT